MKTITVIFDGEIVAPMGYASSKKSISDTQKKTKYQALPTMAGHFIIPGEQLAGALRRAGMDDIRRAFDDEHITSILSYYQARVGGIAGFGKTYKQGEMAELRRKNPFLSLWGKAGMAGHLGMGHALGPVSESVETTIGKDNQPYNKRRSKAERIYGFRADDLARNLETDVPLSFWQDREVLKFAGKSPENTKVLGIHAKKSGNIFDFQVPESPVDAEIVENGTEEEDVAAEKGKLTNIQNGFGGFEYLPNETCFSHRFTVSGTEAEIMMLMASFNGFANKPRLGGHWRNNLGWVDMDYTVYMRDDDPRLRLREVGKLKIYSHLGADNLNVPAIETTDQVKKWMEAYLDLRQAGFPGIDINAGVEGEEATIRARLQAAIKPKKGKNGTPANVIADSAPASTGDSEEDDDVA
jgi:hypothetical protein